MRTHQSIFFLIGFLFLINKAYAQLSTGEVEVFKEFEAQLQDAKKVKIPPVLPPADTSGSVQQYAIQPIPLNVQYLPPRIRPIALRREKLPDAYNGYIRLGIGTPRSIFTEGSYYTNSDQLDFGVDILHHSANNTNTLQNQRFSTNRFGVNGAYHFTQGFALGADFGYDLDFRHFYGYNNFPGNAGNDTLSFAQNEVRQRFSTFHGGINLFNDAPNQGDIDYNADFDFYFMDDNYGTRESGITVDLQGTKWFEKKNPLTIKLFTDLVGYRDTTAQNLSVFMLNGSYTYHSRAFKVKGGLTIGTSENQFGLFPDIEVAFKLAANYITIVAGADGKFQNNSFRTLTDYNPFLVSQVQLQNTKNYRVYAGIRGEFFGINYRLQGEWKPTEGLPLFLSTQDTIPRFQVLFDTGSVTSIIAELGFSFSEDLTVNGTLTQNFFSLDNNEKPWHLPSFIVNAEARYATLEGKLELVASAFVENGVPAQDINGETVNLGALFDVSVGGEFLISKNFGLFLQLNNLANNRRERWQYYPILGFNVLGGISARF